MLTRLDKTYQAFFRRLKTGQTPGFPRFQGRNRYHSFTYKQYGNGARLENGILVLSKIGRMAVRWSRPLAGTPKTVTLSREADGWYACCSRAAVPAQPLPPTGRETGIDVGLQVFLVTAEGDAVEHPRHYRRAEKRLAKAQRRVSRRKKGSHRRRKAVGYLQRAHQTVQRQRPGLPPQGRAGPVAAVRLHLPRRFAGRQFGTEPPPGQEHQRCRLGRVPRHPRGQGSMRRASGGGGVTRVYLAGL